MPAAHGSSFLKEGKEKNRQLENGEGNEVNAGRAKGAALFSPPQ